MNVYPIVEERFPHTIVCFWNGIGKVRLHKRKVVESIRITGDQDAGRGGKPTRIVRILSGDSRYFPGCNSRRTREQKLLVPDNIAALW